MERAEPALVIRGARVARCDGDGDAQGRLALLEDGAVAFGADGAVTFVGRTADAPDAGGGTEIVYARGALLTPGLVDPHTHLVFAGRRTHEFEQKMRGVDYRTIAASGGGIAFTVAQTRAADEATLRASMRRRLEVLLAGGVTTVEVKSGYGLTLADELRLLTIARDTDLPEDDPRAPRPRTIPTLLGAHAVPREHQANRAAYVALVADEMIPAAARDRLAASVDVYLDEGAFSLDEARVILGSAARHGLAIKAHVGQFRDLGGAELVAELGGLSCDHLEAVGDAGLDAMAKAGTRAVLLPAAWRTLRQTPPDAARMRARGVLVAVGTDANPGTSPCLDLPLCAALAVRDAGLDPNEALLSITAESARAIGVSDAGRIAVGARADLALWDHDDPTMFAYAMGGHRPTRVWARGRPVSAPALPLTSTF
jgi:imidazolonepropionase